VPSFFIGSAKPSCEKSYAISRKGKEKSGLEFVIAILMIFVMRKIKHCERGFTRVDLLVTVAVVLVIAALVAMGGFFVGKTRQQSGRVNCTGNMKACQLAFMVWAGDNNGRFPMEVSTNLGGTLEFISERDAAKHFQVMSNELSTGRVLICPADTRIGTTNFTSDFKNANISYFVGQDASKSSPQAWLCGDRNITNGVLPSRGHLALKSGQSAGWTSGLHNGYGNVAVSGGGVDLISNRRLQEALKGPTGWTNRIILPE
jgi:hypothetical protein